jgi:hypothetical protein
MPAIYMPFSISAGERKIMNHSFENRIRERSLTSFEMTGIVIPSGCEESFPGIFIIRGRA